ncbi:xaa-Pro aminopeptidase 2 [Canis lupus baileyi]|uniref:Xaa-Pro aminopeptidase 2 n=2 Tax=Canis lupus familiaris TaxID=9615 RepID=A0A8C0N8P2_CANLF|nr:xaa-Pro aminopeptidase 2 [Canis lupus familiaris]XP_038320843.1 xaa-Pro aminopeptidase 2 [Canis lupus familiaris]XP_038444196.1 xaa-Pro aminopeptidase 2 [Canis lupus familiaris]
MAWARWGCCPWLVFLCALGAWGHPKAVNLTGEDVRNCSISPPYLPVTAVNTTAQLTALRQQMHNQSLSAYIIPETDAHMSEYIGKRDKRRAWITGFTGSAGTAVVSMGKAGLWTDSRYWTQAERQMDCNWELHKEVDITSIVTWLLAEVPAGGHVGFDPFLFSIGSWKSYYTALKNSNIQLVSITDNLVDLAWGSEKPLFPSQPIYALKEAFTGSTWKEKVSDIRSQMQKHRKGPTAVLLSALDETAWLFNLRGSDIPYNPFFYSYTLLTDSSIRLFVNKSCLDSETLKYLNSSCSGSMCVQIENYSQVRGSVQTYASGDVKIWIGTSYTTYGLYEVIPLEKLIEDTYSPVMVTKAVKNSKEQALLRASHVRDAVAVIRYLVWLEKNVPKGTVDEFSGAELLDKFRGEEDFSSGPSFETISASGLNAALAHYSPTKEQHRKLSSDEMYLLDSGGQYWDGTTDITRTVHWGTPSAFQKEAYTRVLIGNIDLSRLVFPASTSGRMMEIFARRALWDVGLNYGHGTGHGIGNFLCVHEWPVGFQSGNIPMAKGMFTSIEPGYYQDGEFGIRIEDVAVVVEAKTKYPGSYLTFEVVSLVPYDRNLIDISLLSPEHLQYLNHYYQTIREKVGPELQRRQLQEEFQWLQRHTEPLSARALRTTSLAPLLVVSSLIILGWSV